MSDDLPERWLRAHQLHPPVRRGRPGRPAGRDQDPTPHPGRSAHPARRPLDQQPPPCTAPDFSPTGNSARSVPTRRGTASAASPSRLEMALDSSGAAPHAVPTSPNRANRMGDGTSGEAARRPVRTGSPLSRAHWEPAVRLRNRSGLRQRSAAQDGDRQRLHRRADRRARGGLLSERASRTASSGSLPGSSPYTSATHSSGSGLSQQEAAQVFPSQSSQRFSAVTSHPALPAADTNSATVRRAPEGPLQKVPVASSATRRSRLRCTCETAAGTAHLA